MRSVTSAALDACAVLAFVAIGRSVHADGVTLAGLASTTWPFAAGAGVGWAAVRAWRRPSALVPSGVAVWLACVGVGMVLRVIAGQGTKAAFVAVALAFLGAELLGWRVVARLVPGRLPARRRGAHPERAVQRALARGGRA